MVRRSGHDGLVELFVVERRLRQLDAEQTDRRFHPDWQVWLNNSASKQSAMDVDARHTAHPIQQAIADESEAQSVFDSITYNKSQA